GERPRADGERVAVHELDLGVGQPGFRERRTHLVRGEVAGRAVRAGVLEQRPALEVDREVQPAGGEPDDREHDEEPRQCEPHALAGDDLDVRRPVAAEVRDRLAEVHSEPPATAGAGAGTGSAATPLRRPIPRSSESLGLRAIRKTVGRLKKYTTTRSS